MSTYKWREQIKLASTDQTLVDELLSAVRNEPHRLVDSNITTEQIETMALAARWHASPKMLFRATRRIVRVLTESFFEDVFVKDIYMPPGIDVVQIVPELEDPICRHSLMFFLPNETWPNYYLITSDGEHTAQLQVRPTFKVSEISRENLTEELVNPDYLSLIAAIGFVADSDEFGLMRHLVLNRDSEKYEHARAAGNIDTMHSLEHRARRNHKNERLVDTFSLELGEVAQTSSAAVIADPRGTKRPHLRRGHFRKVRYGPGKTLVKIKWTPPIVVREDLLTSETEKLLRPNG